MSDFRLSSRAIERAIRVSYAQAMLASVYAASTGGMFIIGYALKLGATNEQLGLMTTIPMFAVVAQLLSSIFVERGASRRRMTIAASIANVLGWAIIIAVPYAMARSSENSKIAMLIGVITLVTIFAHVSANARASWIGDLIPERQRGMFFGKLTMYAGIVGAVIAVLEGSFLDSVKQMGISAFTWLFAFAMLCGLVTAGLFLPQSDVKTQKHDSGGGFPRMAGETFRNRALMAMVLYAFFWSMQAIAAPFMPTYVLRDVGVPFLGLGLVSAVTTIAMLVSSPFWGRMIDHYGCKPVLVACTAFVAPVNLAWIWVTTPLTFYAVIGPINLLVGFAVGGISVASSTLIYKITPNVGRSAQLAIYSVVVVVLAAPMPVLGGHLPSWLKAMGIHADLRCTFYACAVFITAAVIAARRIPEHDSRDTSEMVSNLPKHLVKPATLPRENKPEEADLPTS